MDKASMANILIGVLCVPMSIVVAMILNAVLWYEGICWPVCYAIGAFVSGMFISSGELKPSLIAMGVTFVVVSATVLAHYRHVNRTRGWSLRFIRRCSRRSDTTLIVRQPGCLPREYPVRRGRVR